MPNRDIFLALTLLVCTLGISQAIFFGRDNQVARSEGRAIEQECLAQADEGNCEFYNCFEKRLPCGRDWYILKHGQFYCNKIERMKDAFPEQAQVFLKDSQRCLMQSLKDAYKEDVLDCHDLEHQAIAAISNCFMDNAFCSALHGNYVQFFQIYEVDDLFSNGAGKVWREIARLSARCGGEVFASLADGARSQLENFANHAENALSNAGETVSDAFEDAAEEIQSRFSSLFSGKKK